jgi:crotonobetainyl-CoA:carnitine CoA-transferase CaiB-like acyl-CoA transferase
VIAVGTERQFRNLCDVLELRQVADDARWTTNADRVSNRDALVEALETSLRKRPDDYWLRELRKVDVPCSPINDIQQAFQLAEQLNLDAIQALVRDDGASVSTVSNPIAFSRTPVSYRRAPPKLGADNDGVLGWLARITGRKS